MEKANTSSISSAEITATYRCEYPNISGDSISKKLVSSDGRALAQAFIDKYSYPLAPLKISLCAGYFLREATRLLAAGQYDACISCASGFSMLNYLIAKNLDDHGAIQYWDSDFEHMIKQRNTRIDTIANTLDQTTLKRMKSKALDIERAYTEKLSLQAIFTNCQRPLFILDGVSYFLSQACLYWLFEQIASYEHSAIMLYYWPDTMLQESQLFSKVYQDLNQGMILEKLKSFWDMDTLKTFREYFKETSNLSLKDVERIFIHDDKKCQLKDLNHYFPVRVIVGESG